MRIMKKSCCLPYLIMGVLLLGGGFFTGLGLQHVYENIRIREEYENSPVAWKKKLAEGAEESLVRDIRNRELLNNFKYISMKYDLIFRDSTSWGTAEIMNQKESVFCCKVQLIRDATGELLYESGILEPGFSLSSIRLQTVMQKGYYPCTAVWSFYTLEDEYAGETAWKAVVIIEN